MASSLLILALFAIVFASVGVATAFSPVETHRDCFNSNSTDTDVCVENVLRDYELINNNAKNQIETLERHNEFLNGNLNLALDANRNGMKELQDEVTLWKNKYSYVIAQHGNYSIQDQITNLTDRVTAVETKAATNESLIYIVQNMLRTVQTDIADIFLKINSVR